MKVTGATKLIDDRGGCLAISEALNWPYTTVHTYYRTDKMPDYRRAAIEALPKKKRPEARSKKRDVPASGREAA